MNYLLAKTFTERWTLTGKKALLTGATKGIGLAIAEEFLSLGAEVVIVARNQDKISQVLESWQTWQHLRVGIKLWNLSSLLWEI